MKHGMWIGALALGLAIVSTSFGQAPGIPPAAAGVAAPTAAPANLWSFLLPTAEQKAACKTCFCNSPIGKLASGAGGSLSMMSGGLLPNRCVQNAIANDVKKPAESSEGAAARIKADEEAAKARRAAIRYLGTVDCNYWPNAIDALSEGLRGDPSECVRFEAALALRNGCCCTKKIIKALETCVAGKNDDGFPIERSERVRAAALEALERCPRMQDDPPIKTDEKKKKLTMGEGNPSVDPKAYYKKIGEMSDEQIVASARATLVSLKDRGKIQQAGGNGVSSAPAFASSGPHRPSSLVGIVNHAFAPDASGAARPPFFAGLTRTLTGRQDFGVPARGEMGTPAKGGVARIGDPRTEIIVPALVGDANTPRPREFKASLGVEIIQPMPSGPPASGAPREGRGYITVDPAPTTLPALPEIPKIQPVRP